MTSNETGLDADKRFPSYFSITRKTFTETGLVAEINSPSSLDVIPMTLDDTGIVTDRRSLLTSTSTLSL